MVGSLRGTLITAHRQLTLIHGRTLHSFECVLKLRCNMSSAALTSNHLPTPRCVMLNTGLIPPGRWAILKETQNIVCFVC